MAVFWPENVCQPPILFSSFAALRKASSVKLQQRMVICLQKRKLQTDIYLVAIW